MNKPLNFKQEYHRTPIKMLTYNGKTLSINDWSRVLGIPKTTITSRIQRRLGVDKVLSKMNGTTGKEFV